MRLLGRIAAVVVLTAVAVVLTALAQSSGTGDEAAQLHRQGQQLMREGNWLRAVKLFDELIARFPEAPDRDLFLFERAKANYYLGDLNAAMAEFDALLEQYPEMPEAAHAYYFRGNAAYRAGRLDLAFASYVKAYGRSEDPRLDQLCLDAVEDAVLNATAVGLSADDFDELSRDRRCAMIEVVSHSLLQRGDSAVAGELQRLCAAGEPGATVPPIAQETPSRGRAIALVLPFSTELNVWAEEIYDGALVARERLRAEEGLDLAITAYDSKGDPVEAARAARELAKAQNTIAAIGPLTSEAAAVAVAALACEDLPLIVPAATQAGLTQLSPNAFQLAPNIALQGICMAQYAIDSLKARAAAVITSTDPDHVRMARAFRERFETLGGHVVAVEYYRPRDTDFGPVLEDLKTVLLKPRPDSTVYVNLDGDTIEFDDVSAYVDCLFLPGDAQQLRLLLPQIQFYRVQGPFLGSDGWADTALYELGDEVTRHAVFPSPFLEVANTKEYVGFAAWYDAKYGKRPTRLDCLGYDAVRLVGLAVKQGNDNRRELVDFLSKIARYPGASGMITLGADRENIEMPLFRLVGGQALPLSSPPGGDHGTSPAP